MAPEGPEGFPPLQPLLLWQLWPGCGPQAEGIQVGVILIPLQAPPPDIF